MKNKKIVGGMFGWEESGTGSINKYPFLYERNHFLLNGRSAIFSILDILKPQKIWLPDYLCETILIPINKINIKIEFYRINSGLEIEELDWIAEINKNDIVILIEYFGFPVEQDIINEIKKRKAIIVKDAAQSLFSRNIQKNIDFTVFSPRKFVGVPAGGIVQTKNNNYLLNISLQDPSTENLFFIYNAFHKRTLFDAGNDIEWFQDYKLAEQSQITGNYRIDDLSLSLLKFGIDYEVIKRKRRENFQYLLDKLTDIAIFKQLKKDIYPMAFPVLVENRKEILESLYEEKIYTPVHWPVSSLNRPYNRELKDKEISIVCDQKTDIGDLDKIVKIVKSKLSY